MPRAPSPTTRPRSASRRIALSQHETRQVSPGQGEHDAAGERPDTGSASGCHGPQTGQRRARRVATASQLVNIAPAINVLSAAAAVARRVNMPSRNTANNGPASALRILIDHRDNAMSVQAQCRSDKIVTVMPTISTTGPPPTRTSSASLELCDRLVQSPCDEAVAPVPSRRWKSTTRSVPTRMNARADTSTWRRPARRPPTSLSHPARSRPAMKCGKQLVLGPLVQNDLALLQTFGRRPAHGQLPDVDPFATRRPTRANRPRPQNGSCVFGRNSRRSATNWSMFSGVIACGSQAINGTPCASHTD